jgi:CDP-glycerol glycerophosphotransferase (TagB/SpsB family)
MDKQCVALNYASHTHYNDHLAPISVIMNIPLLVVETVDYDICKKLYPEVKVEITEYYDFNPEFLIANYDVLFMSDLWDREVLKEKFRTLEAKYEKVIRNVHVPHGYSDKGFYLRKAANEDITLIYGQNMLDMFRHEGVLSHLHQYVITGNYRYTYFKKHEAFYDEVMEKEILCHLDMSKQTILYAPTWMDLEESGTYFECIDELLKNLPAEYNIIVKPHPQLELDDTSSYYRILGKYKNHPQVLFLTDFPLIYPLLKYTDLYIGDMSSIGYDYLVFNRPMYFLNKENRNPKRDRRSFLYNCGVDIKNKQIPRIFDIIERSIDGDAEKYKNIRAEVWEYTFGQEKSFETIREELIKIIDTPIDEKSFFYTRQ